MDKINNTITSNYTVEISINIGLFDLQLGILNIKKDNTCPICKDGMTIHAVSIAEYVGTNQTVLLSVENDKIYLVNNEISLDVQ